MTLPTLLLPPDQSGYAAKFGHTVVSTALDGGASRYRADQQGASFTVDVHWTLDKRNYEYICAFYRTAIAFGSQPFLLPLYLDSTDLLVPYTVHFVPDTFGLISQTGQTFVVGATLEVLPDPSKYVDDAAKIAAGPD